MTRSEYVEIYVGDGTQDTPDLAHVVMAAVQAAGWEFRHGSGGPEYRWVFKNRFGERHEVIVRKEEKA